MIPKFDQADEEEDEWGHHSHPPEDGEAEQSPQELRQMANTAFQSHDLDSALPLYSMAIDKLLIEINAYNGYGDNNDNIMEENQNKAAKDDSQAQAQTQEERTELMIILLCNRSVCLHKMDLYDDAKNDAAEAWRISQNKSAKAAFRLAKAQLALKEFEEAIVTLQSAVEFISVDIIHLAANYNVKLDQKQKQKQKRINRNENENNNNQTDKQLLGNNSDLYGDVDLEKEQQKIQTQKELKQELQKLLQVAQYHHLKIKNIPNPSNLSKLTSVRTAGRAASKSKSTTSTDINNNYQPSIREFTILNELGEGNYSRVVAVKHTVTNETFALKMIEKKKVESLAKRQHPNVRNEIQMEKRILGDRLGLEEKLIASQKVSKSINSGDGDGDDDGDSNDVNRRYGWSRLVNMYHTFQDYNHLYYLMDLHVKGGDMWSTLRHGEKMVGTHHSLARLYLFELLEALEFIHARGVVHRDLKAENLLLSSTGHLILIDFGTAKDLIETDLNGPEFVGTPDFMPPEAVKGTGVTGGDNDDDDGVDADRESDHTLDLWSYGAVAYQLLTGSTPFSSPSQYLAFLKIQRGLLCRPMGITNDNAWDLITKLMKVKAKDRFGSECFKYVKGENGEPNKMIETGDGYDTIRSHPYFAGMKSCPPQEETMPVPSLKDLCIRACGQLVQDDSLNLEIDKTNPPGDGSSHDMLRMTKDDRGRVMDFLDRLRVLSQPRVYRRFFKTKQEARLGKVRESTRDFVGLAQMNDKQYQFPMKDSENTDEERSDVIATIFPILYMQVSNPLFNKETNLACTDEERKIHISALKDSLRKVNKTRPKIVVASGYFDEQCRKVMGKVNESIPVAINDGSSFYSFWSRGGQGLVLRTKDFMEVDPSIAQKSDQGLWLKQELEQCRMTQHHTFAFVDCDPFSLPDWLLKLLTKGRVMCLFGPHRDFICREDEHRCVANSKDEPNEDSNDSDNDDDVSLSSMESGPDEEEYRMKIIARGDNTLRCVNLEEYGKWNFEDI